MDPLAWPILPVIVGPSLFRQTPSLSVFQAVNDPSRPLSAMNKHEQEETLQKLLLFVDPG
jgi:hypothetical protein